MAERTVLLDRIAYYTADPKPPGTPGADIRERLVADRGTTVNLIPSELARLEKLGAVGTSAEYQALISGKPIPIQPTTDANLAAMTVGDMVAWLAEHPDDGERIEELMGIIETNAQTAHPMTIPGSPAARRGTTPAAPSGPAGPTSSGPDASGPPPSQTTSKGLVPGSEDDPTTAALEAPTSGLTDAELEAMNRDEVVAHLDQFNGDLDRVETLEKAGKGRKTVLEHVDRLREAREALELDNT